MIQITLIIGKLMSQSEKLKATSFSGVAAYRHAGWGRCDLPLQNIIFRFMCNFDVFMLIVVKIWGLWIAVFDKELYHSLTLPYIQTKFK